MSNLELITNKDSDNNQDKMQFETYKDLIEEKVNYMLVIWY